MESKMTSEENLEKNFIYGLHSLLKRFDDPNREGLIETPKRVMNAYKEILTAVEPKITIFDSNGYDQMIVEKDIPFYTLCEHHLLPFFGTVHIGYIPKKKIIGLSKLARIVHFFSHRLNTQEYLTKNISEFLQKKLNPRGCAVIIQARHLCKEMRGIGLLI